MAPLRGRAPRGRRLHAKVPHGRWKTVTFWRPCATINRCAMFHRRADRRRELSHLCREGSSACPSTRRYLILDNLGSHRSKAVRQLIRSVGAKLFFLPKYLSDLNPIEQVFAKLKHLPRKAPARTVDAVCAAIGQALDAFTPDECAKYLKNSGYRT